MPIPKVEQPESSAVGIAVKTRAPFGWPTEEPRVVFFVRVDNERDIRQPSILRSNYAKDGRVYLLNVPPGEYAAVASFYAKKPIPAAPVQPGFSVSVSMGRTGYTTYFPKELVEQTRVSVGKGQFVFAGSYVVSTSVGLSEADQIQLHYAEVIAPGASKSGIGHMFSGDYHYRGSIHEAKRDDNTKNEFLMKAKVDLAEGGWSAIVK
jgi:hypothetical protein